MGKYQVTIPTIVAATATTVGQPINVENACAVTIFGQRSNHGSGASAFSVEVSADGTNYVAYSKLISNATNTNVQGLTRVASFSLADNGVGFASMDYGESADVFKFIRVTATETTDGTHDAWVVIQYDS